MIAGIPVLELMGNKALSRQIEEVQISLARERQRLLAAKVIDAEVVGP
jgi:hypothetical protein